MAFVWTSVSAGTKEVTTHVNEAKDNVDTLADNLGVAQYSWSEMPVVQDEGVGQPQIQELQDATDYIDNLNTCSSENAGYDSTVDASDYGTVDSVADATANSSEDSTVDSTQNSSENSALNSGIDTTRNGTILSGQNTTVDSNQHSIYESSYDYAYKSTQLVNVFVGPGA